MASTLLTMVNDLRVLLREEQISAISATDQLTQALIRLINKSTKEVLGYKTWSFDKRTDGSATFLGPVEGTELTTHAAGSDNVVIDAAAGANAILTGRITRFRVSNDTLHPDLTYRVIYVDPLKYVGRLTLYTDPYWIGETSIAVTDATWQLFCVDYVLPSTVKKVLSVRDEEQPIQVEFSEKEIFWDRIEPRVTDSTGQPYTVIIGGTGTNTYNNLLETGGDSGMVMSIRPAPDTDYILYYDYVYAHPDMSAATDTLLGVPERIIQLIVDRSFYHCLNSDIEADPVRAAASAKQYRIDLELASREDRVSPNRRRVMRPVGAHVDRHPNYRWQTREVPSP